MRIIVLPGERPCSWNKFNTGVHWTKRKKEVDRVHMVVRAALTGDETPYTHPVDIQFVAYFDKRPLDASNIYVKPYEDALKGWLIVDDSPKYVRSVKALSAISRQNPRMEIIIYDGIA
jgi:hypothetical protein